MPNALSVLLGNSQNISVAWTTSVWAMSLDGISVSIVAAFDRVDRFVKDDSISRFWSRFAYLQLKYAIDALKTAAATKDGLHRLVQRKKGYSNASLAIDLYLSAKRDTSGGTLSREKLSEYRRLSTRWAQLAEESPIQMSAYSDAAETIMYDASDHSM